MSVPGSGPESKIAGGEGWDPARVTWPPVPWEAAQPVLDALYALSGAEFEGVLSEWQRGDPAWLDRLGDQALLALRMATEAECACRFGRCGSSPP